MTWEIKWEERALKELKKLRKKAQQDILRYLRERITTDKDPKRFGKPLTGNKLGLWRYRINDYRIICQIQNHNLVVLVVKVNHRRQFYK